MVVNCSTSRVVGCGVALAYCATMLCFCGHIVLDVQAADVLPQSLVLAYTVDKACPSGWVDLSTDSTYRGRMIKGWNQPDDLGMTRGLSSANTVITHTHPDWSNHLLLSENAGVVASAYNTITGGQNILYYNGDVDINQVNSAMDSKSSGIQSTFSDDPSL
jgi:hypothetical protein